MSIKQEKKYIHGVVVVEGKTDTQKIQKLFDVETIETNGSAINAKTINLIKHAAKTKPIILLLDPDGPGEKIRTTILNEIDQCLNVFIKKTDMFPGSHKIGIAEAKEEVLLHAFEHLISFTNTKQSLAWDEYLSLNLNTAAQRQLITDYLGICQCNHKKLFKYLNMMNFSLKELKQVLHV